MNYLEKYDLKGRRALVTGAGRGIGRACAEALALTGALVICTDKNGAAAENTANVIEEYGKTALSCELDVTNTKSIEKLAKSEEKFDIVVCNAGVVSWVDAHSMEDVTWNDLMDVNLTGVFKTCRSFARKMIDQNGGVFVNIGSMSGNIINDPQSQTHYNVSKAAVHHLTKSLAVEWAKYNIRVNAVAPTYIQTELLKQSKDIEKYIADWERKTPMKRLGQTHEVASAVQFLSSDASSLITGTILNVDGGYTCL
jgi:NAD(P)-dependent dehydrogenase (short-subunit alcohol dehydrogenase family)|tara:strand:+ start:223 stop:984 length:762 start_codon:yes stop_codon:yes gene_type:complete